MILIHSELGSLFWRGLAEPDSIDPDEKRRFVMTFNTFMRRESLNYYLHQEGLMPDKVWEARARTLAGVLNQPGTKVYLDSAGDTLPEDFYKYLQEVMSSPSIMSEFTHELFVGDKGS